MLICAGFLNVFPLPSPRLAILGTIASIVLLAAVACTDRTANVCPELSTLLQQDPVQNATAAIRAGDNRLLAIGGLVGSTPGVQSSALSTRELPGTSDTESAACKRYRSAARDYAYRYSQTVVRLLAQSNPR
jgi:hypothetical protein